MSLTPLDNKAVRRSFDRAAPSYDCHAVLQREVESRLLERIEFQRVEPQTILDLGCGTGSASRQLADRYAEAVVLALDWAPAMLAESRSHAATASSPGSGPYPVCADMHVIPLAARSVDLVFSNLALQWSYDLPAVFREFRRIMRAGAMLVFSCYGPDTLFELKQSWREVDDFQHVNDHPDMHDIGDELMAAGFREPVMDAEHLTVDYPDLISLMKDLKGTGERNAASQRFTGLTGKGRLNRLKKAYEQYQRNERCPASYEVIYGAAFAPAEGQPVKTPDGDVATFSVDALRSRSNNQNPS